MMFQSKSALLVVACLAFISITVVASKAIADEKKEYVTPDPDLIDDSWLLEENELGARGVRELEVASPEDEVSEVVEIDGSVYLKNQDGGDTDGVTL